MRTHVAAERTIAPSGPLIGLRGVRGVMAALGTALAFKLASDLSALFLQPDGASFLFPPAAVILAAAAAFGGWGVLGVCIGTALSQIGAAATPAGAALFVLVHGATALVPAIALRRPDGGAWTRLWRTIVYGGVLPNLLSALLGTAALLYLGYLPAQSGAILRNLSFWWTSDLIAAIAIGMPLLAFLRPEVLMIPKERIALSDWLRNSGSVELTAALLVTALAPAFLLPRFGWGFPHWLSVMLSIPIALAALQGGIGPALLVNGIACSAYMAALVSAPIQSLNMQGTALQQLLAPGYSSVAVFTGFAVLGGWMASRNRRLLERLREQQKQLRRDFEVAVASLAGAIEAKDPSTQGHVQRVAMLAVQVGARLDMSERELSLLRHGAVLHDVGKIGVPESILNKPGPLTPEEKAIMEQHVEIGLRIVNGVEELREVEPLIRYHQERCSRREEVTYPGYFGLAGTQIPLGARILSVVDTYDAITEDRPYRAGRPRGVAIDELRREAGRQFDPDVVEAFIAVIQELPEESAAHSVAALGLPETHQVH